MTPQGRLKQILREAPWWSGCGDGIRGDNNLRGTAFGYVRPDSFESDFTQVTTPNGTVNRRPRNCRTSAWKLAARL